MDWLRENIDWLVHWDLPLTYILLFIGSVIEGPKLSVFLGVLCAQRILDTSIIYAIVVLGDIIGDAFWYSLGRFVAPAVLPKIVRMVGVQEKHLQKTREAFNRYSMRALVVSKLAYGPGLAGLIVAGALQYPYKRFFWRCAIVSFIQVAVFVGLGYAAGSGYLTEGSAVDVIISVGVGIAVIVVGFYLIRHLSPHIQRLIKRES
jgi:membrane protein DedA with SNARE-associated domain